MADDLLWVPLADVIKNQKNADGSITVIGAVSNPKVDLDRQIMDPAFVKRELPSWFGKRANVREMHQPIAVGKGKQLDVGTDGLYVLTSKIIEPSAAKKVEEGVLSAYSVGVKNARVVKDADAPNGRIVDGTIVEVSLVDYPASDVGRFTIAKAATPDADTGAVALTEDELKAVDAELVPAAVDSADASPAGSADVGKGPALVQPSEPSVRVAPPGPQNPSTTVTPATGGGVPQKQTPATGGGKPSPGSPPATGGGKPGSTTTPATGGQQPSASVTTAPSPAGQAPGAPGNLTPDKLRAAALVLNPTASADDLAALVSVWQTITSPNLKSRGITGDAAPPAKPGSDPDAGASTSVTTDVANSSGGDDSTNTLPQKARMTDLAGVGGMKAALADDEVKKLLADAAKAAVPDLVKAAVEEATKGLIERVAKLEKSPAPSGPYVGPPKTFAIETTGVPVPTKPPADDPKRLKLEAMAQSDDPLVRNAAKAALAEYATP